MFQLVAAGFDVNMAKLALKKHSGDIMKAAEELLNSGGFIDGDLSDFDGKFKSMDYFVCNFFLVF